MPKITPKSKKPGAPTDRQTIIAKTMNGKKDESFQSFKWWLAENKKDLCNQIISTANYLQKTQQYRVKQASIYSRVYNGKPLYNYALNSKLLDTSNQMPINRPTFNVSQSCIDTLVSRITQSKPRPRLLTAEGDYKEEMLAKQLNQFIGGEFYRSDIYSLGPKCLRDSMVIGDGIVKILEKDKKATAERKLCLQLYVDKNDAYYGNPRTLIEIQVADRDTVSAMFPKEADEVDKAVKAYVDGSAESSETISDQIMLVEGWHLPSFEGAGDGKHVIACSSGVLLEEPWTKSYFPFSKLSYEDPIVGWYSQGLIEANLGTQIAINKLLITMDSAINLVGVPRIFIDEVSKVLETAFNNNVGTIIKYRGTKPIYEVAPCMPQETYEHLQRLITYYYQQTGVSALAASGQKPSGLNSGEAIRSYMDQQTDRFSLIEDKYDKWYIDIASKMIDLAKDIADRDGSYSTVYPNKNGLVQIDLPAANLLKDSYTIQIYDESSLPRDPAGRYARLSEMLAANEITLEEFRDLNGTLDLSESDKLANSLRERIKKTLYQIVESGKYEAPDVFMLDPSDLATTLTVQFINLYSQNNLEESKMQKLRDFFTQIQMLKQQAAPPPVQAPPQQSQGQLPPPETPNAPISPTSNVQV